MTTQQIRREIEKFARLCADMVKAGAMDDLEVYYLTAEMDFPEYVGNTAGIWVFDLEFKSIIPWEMGGFAFGKSLARDRKGHKPTVR